MQLTDFCAQSSKILAQQPSVILFTSKNYSPLSFAQILYWLQQQNFLSFQKLDFDLDLNQIQMKLYTTFLGQSCIFWFGDVSLISAKKKRTDWLQFLQSYEGPHQIIGWLSEDDVSVIVSTKLDSNIKNIKIEVPEKISSEMVHKISFLYQGHKPEIAAYFFGRLYRYHKEFSLEQLCLLSKYAGILGKSMDLFFDAWLKELVISDVSLFYLAQLFFEKKADQFFTEWHIVRSHYSEQFWTVFFSDQLFKAYFYVCAQGRIDQAQKQMTYGLPFSFLKHDWKLYQPSSLQQAHEQIYNVDIALKNGGNNFMIDGFFVKYLAG
ncbi:hypothetical protein KBB68_00195 [Candidatus Babeliales bacterium]|nr:hypothetical protein [Candidatus Babeliales bacterium]